MYKILRSTDPSSLADEVNTAIAAGSVPIGGPTLTREGIWCQAVGPGAGDTLPEGSVAVANGDHITVHNSAGTAVAGTHTAEVADGALSDVKLAATIAPVADGATFAGVTGSGTNATITVAGGVITGIALSE